MKIVEIHNDAESTLDQPHISDAFIDTLIDAVELVQKAERICPDALLRFHVHRALLELVSAVEEAAKVARAVES